MKLDLDGIVGRVKEKKIGMNVRDEVIEWGRRNGVLVSDFGSLSGEEGLENCKKIKERLIEEKLWED